MPGLGHLLLDGQSSEACHSEDLCPYPSHFIYSCHLSDFSFTCCFCYFQHSLLWLESRARRKESTPSYPDLTSLGQSTDVLRLSLYSVWKTQTRNLQNLCVSSGMAGWEQRTIETAKLKPQMSPGKMWLIAKWMTWARNTGDSEGGKINVSLRLTWAINHHSFLMAVTPIGYNLQMKEASSW